MREDLDTPAQLSAEFLAAHTQKPISARNSAGLQKLAYSVREAADLTGLGRSTIYVLLGQKKLASLRIGGRRLIPHAALIALLGGE
jgi:excisionase family DNA binding protein